MWWAAASGLSGPWLEQSYMLCKWEFGTTPSPGHYLRRALEPPKACWAQGLSCSLLNVGSVYETKPAQNPMPKMLRQIACPNLPHGSMRFSAHEDQGGLAVPEEWGGMAVLGFPATLGHSSRRLFYTHQWLTTEEVLSENITWRVKFQEPLNRSAVALKGLREFSRPLGCAV